MFPESAFFEVAALCNETFIYLKKPAALQLQLLVRFPQAAVVAECEKKNRKLHTILTSI